MAERYESRYSGSEIDNRIAKVNVLENITSSLSSGIVALQSSISSINNTLDNYGDSFTNIDSAISGLMTSKLDKYLNYPRGNILIVSSNNSQVVGIAPTNAIASAIDSALSSSGYAADALAVGREFAHFDTLEEGIVSSALWEGNIRKGYTIINGDGSQTNNKRARTSFVPGNKVCIELTGGYECFVAGYGLGPELTADNFIATLVSSWTSGFFAVPRTAPKISVVFRRKADDRALTDADVDDIRANFKLYSIVDGTLSQRGYPADAWAVGNALEDVRATSGITTRRNNPTYVAQIKTLAESYLNQGFVYGQDTLLDEDTYPGKFIDCSTYVGLLLRGRGFTDTRYGNNSINTATSKTANSAYAWSINSFDFALQKDLDDDALYPVRTASQLAQWMVERGQRVPLDARLSNVLPGDIVFYALKRSSTDEWQCPDRYKHISHVGIVTERVAANSSVAWNTTALPWSHIVMDATSREGSIGSRILESGAEDVTPNLYTSNYNTIVMICRPDLGCL